MHNFASRIFWFVVMEAFLFLAPSALGMPDDLSPWFFRAAMFLLIAGIGFEFGKWVGEGPRHPKPDIGAYSAGRYIVFGEFFTNSDAAPNLNINQLTYAIEEIRQAARDGQIQLWGEPPNMVLIQPIPADYWNNAHIDILTMFHSNDTPVSTESIAGSYDFEAYSELMLNKAQVIKAWRGGWRRGLRRRYAKIFKKSD